MLVRVTSDGGPIDSREPTAKLSAVAPRSSAKGIRKNALPRTVSAPAIPSATSTRARTPFIHSRTATWMATAAANSITVGGWFPMNTLVASARPVTGRARRGGLARIRSIASRIAGIAAKFTSCGKDDRTLAMYDMKNPPA